MNSHSQTTFHRQKFLILGHGRHGKDTVAELMHKHYGISYISSSFALCKEIFPALDAALGYTSMMDGAGEYIDMTEQDFIEYAFQDRSNHRLLWKELITLYNTPDKSALCKLILSQADCYVGLRCDKEYEASRCLFDHILWVDARKRKPYEDTMLVKFDPIHMIWIDNNGTLEELEDTVKQLHVLL